MNISTGSYSDLERPPLRPAALRRALVVPGGFWTDLRVVEETGSTNADAAEAARAGAAEGLVIVAESEVTERAALQVAAERARIAGCNTLGVVMHGTKDRLPGWLRRLVGGRPESSVPRED